MNVSIRKKNFICTQVLVFHKVMIVQLNLFAVFFVTIGNSSEAKGIYQVSSSIRIDSKH